MRLKEFHMICIGMIAKVKVPMIQTIIVTGRIEMLSGELPGMQSPKLWTFPVKWGFEIMIVQVALVS